MNADIEIDDYIFAFEDAWQCGLAPNIADFLPDDPALHEAAQSELVHVDMEYRHNAGERIPIEDYLERFPALREPTVLVSLIQAEFALRRRGNELVSGTEYIRRFPELQQQLERELESTADSATGLTGKRVNCPHCREPIPLAEDAEQQTACPSCGSSIDIRGDNTWSSSALPNLGRFKLLEPVGQGAFGQVYKAMDTELDRIVAAKIPRAGRLTSDEDEERFVREARSVAQLNHPGIVAMHEVGRADGVPFLVTDFVRGTTLADVLATRTFSFRDAAVLIIDVAEALQHAHTRGVVHRDLKPSNIMLELIDDDQSSTETSGSSASGIHREFRTRLMDFGLARRDHADVTMTVEGQILGTPAYMSPEQARGDVHDTDARTDVYSLGVILYELLTGERPFRGSSRMLIQQVIHDQPVSPRRFDSNISRDLETITLKCLEKSPAARYQTATEVVSDLRRWLGNQPILARPVGKVERALRWCARNRIVAGLSAALFVSLIGGLALVTWKWREAENQRTLSETRRIEAEREAEVGDRIEKLYNEVLRKAALQQSDPEKTITMAELLDGASAELQRRFDGDDAVKGSMLRTLGGMYSWLQRYDDAEKHIRRGLALQRGSLGPDHIDTVKSEGELALVLRNLGRPEEAEPLLRHFIDVYKEYSGVEGEKVLWGRNLLAETLRDKGETKSALQMQESLYRDSLRLNGADDEITLTSANNLAGLYYELNDYEAAAPMFRVVWETRVRVLGEKNRDTLTALNNYGVVLKNVGRLDEAEKCYRAVLEADLETLGPEDHDTLTDIHNLSQLLVAQKKFDEAITMFEDLIPRRRKAHGPDHTLVASSLAGLAEALRQKKRFGQAESSLREAIRIREKSLNENHWRTPDTQGLLGELLIDAGRYQDAEAILLESYRALKAIPDIPEFRVRRGVTRLIDLYEKWEKAGEANRWKALRTSD